MQPYRLNLIKIELLHVKDVESYFQIMQFITNQRIEIPRPLFKVITAINFYHSDFFIFIESL
jgi:hypothetical protein